MTKHDGRDGKETDGAKTGHAKARSPKVPKAPFIKQSESAKKHSIATTIATTAATTTTVTTQRTRKVKFADPLTEQRLYDRAASPNAETETQILAPSEASKLIQELEPPLSLVAQLDLAAKKLNARQNIKAEQQQSPSNTPPTSPPSAALPVTAADAAKEGATSSPNKSPNKERRNNSIGSHGEKDMSLKTLRSTKSTKSIMKPTSPKRETKKDKKDKN